MIRFNLRCAQGHDFESWFASGDAFSGLSEAGRIACPNCGSTNVEKALMAPRVRPARQAAERTGEETVPVATPSAPDPEVLEAITKLREHVEKTSNDVGDRFASEARAMHVGDLPERPIHGRASREEARDLIEDGVPVLPLPFVPGRKTN